MIRWIRPNLGTSPFDEIGRSDVFVLDVRHLLDKSGNTVEAVSELLARGRAALDDGRTVVVACDFGISRSNAIAAGLLGLVTQTRYRVALQDVAERTGEHDIKTDMALIVAKALEGEVSAGSADRVLVTGAAGFVGKALCESFSGSDRVLSLNRSDMDLSLGALPLLDYCRDMSVRQIVHLAYPRGYTNPSATGASLNMVRNVLEVCKHTGARLIFVSCHVVYSGMFGDHLLNEAAPLCPRGVFGDMKALEETLVEAHVRRGEVTRSICRFTPIYGPGGTRPRLIKTFQQAAKAGQVIRTHKYRNGRPKLDLLYVTDAVRAIRSVLDHRGADIFHFGSGAFQETRGIAAQICEIGGLPFRHEELPVEDDVSNIAFDAAKAKEVLGWSAQAGFAEGLAACLSRFD